MLYFTTIITFRRPRRPHRDVLGEQALVGTKKAISEDVEIYSLGMKPKSASANVIIRIFIIYLFRLRYRVNSL